MKIVAVSHTGRRSGAEQVLVRLVKALTARGVDVVAVTPAGPLSTVLRAERVLIKAIPELTLSAGPRVVGVVLALVRSARAALTLRSAARDADIVVVNGLLALPAVAMARLSIPVVWLAHDVITRRDMFALLQAVRHRITLVIAVSNAVAESLERFGLPVRVVLNGTPWPVVPAEESAAGRPIIGCAGLLTSWKGQDVLLEAVACLPRRDVRLELVGDAFPKDGDYVRTIRQRAQQPDLAGRVDFVGPVTDVLAAMRRWTIAVSSSVEPEAGPLVAAEAMSVGIPVVATEHGGVSEIVGRAGVLVPPRDPTALAGALEMLLADPQERRRLSRLGRQRVADRLALSERMEELVRTVLSVRGRSLE